jgi:hypothetical protein
MGTTTHSFHAGRVMIGNQNSGAVVRLSNSLSAAALPSTLTKPWVMACSGLPPISVATIPALVPLIVRSGFADGADSVTADVLATGIAAAVSKEPCHRFY